MKLGTALSRFAGGVGGAAASIASKYMDEELLQQRQQTFLEMQRKNTLLTESELDAQRNAPERLARDRENARQGVLAKASAEREGVVAGQSDAAYQGALDKGNLLAIARKKQADEAEASTKLQSDQRYWNEFGKAKEEGLASFRANEQIRADSAIGANAEKRAAAANSFGRKLHEIEDFMGRKLTEEERLVLVGIQKKGNDDVTKLATEAASKMVESGQIKPEEAGPFANRMRQGFEAVRVGAQVESQMGKARSEGKLGEAVKELQAKGLGDDQIKAYLTEAEAKRFIPPAPAEPGVGGFIMDIAERAGKALAPDLNAHAAVLIGAPDKWRIEQVLAMDDDSPAKPLTPENRKKLMQLIGR